MALPLIAAGVAARYGAKKLMKHLTKQTLKKQKGEAAVTKNKNSKTTSPYSSKKDDFKRVPDKRGARHAIRKEYKKLKNAKDRDSEFLHSTNIDDVMSNFQKGYSKTQIKKAKSRVLKYGDYKGKHLDKGNGFKAAEKAARKKGIKGKTTGYSWRGKVN